MDIESKPYHTSFMMIKVTEGSTTIETDVTNMDGFVPDALIEQFEQVLWDLKEYNLYKLKDKKR